MQSPYFKCLRKTCKNVRGFTLVEVMVVMVIVAILATGVVFMFADPTAKVKAVAFEMRGDFNLAKAEAVKENADVLIDFTLGDIDGYQICFDTDDDEDCGDEAAADIIKEVTFREEVQFYDFSDGITPFPTDGPNSTPPPFNTPLDTAAKKDGIAFIDPVDATNTGNNILFSSNGTCNKNNSVIIYYPEEGNKSKIRGNPYSVFITSTATGNVQLSRWRPESGQWSRK